MLEKHNLTFIFNGLLLLLSKYTGNVQSIAAAKVMGPCKFGKLRLNKVLKLVKADLLRAFNMLAHICLSLKGG